MMVRKKSPPKKRTSKPFRRDPEYREVNPTDWKGKRDKMLDKTIAEYRDILTPIRDRVVALKGGGQIP
jgi:hypothetical protein